MTQASWIEILVVVAIAASLAALLFPVFAKARARGRQTACLSNLRQLGRAVFQYAQDSDDRYPYGGDAIDLSTDIWQNGQNSKYWPQILRMQVSHLTLPNVMAGHVKNRDLWRCPSDDGFDEAGAFEDIPLSAHPSCFQAFGMSYSYTTLLALDGRTLGGVRAWSRQPPYSEHEPVNVPLFSDQVGHWHGGSVRHEGRLNMVMVDGHAASVNRDSADQLNNILFTIPAKPTP